ncbi:MAG: SurA N-terminal domain-containing protein, partial [Alphaproteobacteria bacterium]|nr:SurA N-terminal domain-containing protein [Alphaproteobacteria bacterium]
MLESMRNAASGWLAKILIGFLVASFGAWGLSGVAGTTGKKKFAHVGKETLSVRAFQEKLAREIRLIEQKIGHPVTLEDAWSFGIVEQLLDRLLIEATLDNDANIRSLGTTEAAIAKSIIKEKSFKDAFGKFSRAHFRRTLKINGLSEKQYTDLIRNAHRRQQIIAAISTAGAVPGPLIEAVHRFRHEKRIIAYMTLSSDMIEPIAPPVDSLLLAFFEMRKEQFRAPEYRKFEFITLNQEKIAASIKTSDEELKAAYQSRKEMFRRRERREVEQILFENIDEAQTAAERIMNGTASFTDIARERKLGENDLSLGLLEQKNFVDPAVGDAAFSLAPNDVSSPITGKFGTSLLRLIRIESETKRTFKDVSDELQSILSLQAARKKIINIYEKVENERAFGTSLAEISKKFSLPYRIIKLVDSEGYDPEKNKVENIPLRKELLAMLFKAKLNTATNPLQLNDSGFLWFNVPEVIFSRDRTFE